MSIPPRTDCSASRPAGARRSNAVPAARSGLRAASTDGVGILGVPFWSRIGSGGRARRARPSTAPGLRVEGLELLALDAAGGAAQPVAADLVFLTGGEGDPLAVDRDRVAGGRDVLLPAAVGR